MLYQEFKVKENVYKLRLRSIDIINIEEKLGSLMDIMMSLIPDETLGDLEGGTDNMSIKDIKILPLQKMAIILQNSMQSYQHGIGYNETLDIIDEYFDEGHGLMDLFNVVTELLQASTVAKQAGEKKKKTAKKDKVVAIEGKEEAKNE